MLYCIVLYCIVLYCIVLYCIVLYCIVLYCIVLYCIVLYCIVLYCIVINILNCLPPLLALCVLKHVCTRLIILTDGENNHKIKTYRDSKNDWRGSARLK